VGHPKLAPRREQSVAQSLDGHPPGPPYAGSRVLDSGDGLPLHVVNACVTKEVAQATSDKRVRENGPEEFGKSRTGPASRVRTVE
jgi:hypothetical protein